jgi:periplasmic protein TonB
MLVGGVALSAVMIGLFVWFVHTMMAAKGTKKERQVQVVQIIRPPPPPPPDQPPPPPPEKIDQPLPQDRPEPAPNDAPAPSEQLGLDASGTAGSDAFGFAARKGGSDLIGTGGAPFAWYQSKIADAVRERLAGVSIPSKKSVSIKVWTEADGHVKEIRLAQSTGNPELDKKIQTALGSLKQISEARPIEMPELSILTIVPRG